MFRCFLLAEILQHFYRHCDLFAFYGFLIRDSSVVQRSQSTICLICILFRVCMVIYFFVLVPLWLLGLLGQAVLLTTTRLYVWFTNDKLLTFFGTDCIAHTPGSWCCWCDDVVILSVSWVASGWITVFLCVISCWRHFVARCLTSMWSVWNCLALDSVFAMLRSRSETVSIARCCWAVAAFSLSKRCCHSPERLFVMPWKHCAWKFSGNLVKCWLALFCTVFTNGIVTDHA